MTPSTKTGTNLGRITQIIGPVIDVAFSPNKMPNIYNAIVVELLRGSVGVGQPTLTRFYSLHTFVLPLLAAVFMLMHFLMIRKQGISGPL